MKRLSLIALLFLTACSKDEPKPMSVPTVSPTSCGHVINQYDGALVDPRITPGCGIPSRNPPVPDSTICQEVDVQAQLNRDSVQVYLCKAGTNCDTLALIDWGKADGKVFIFKGDTFMAKEWDSYHIQENLCR